MERPSLDKPYLAIVLALMLVLPVMSAMIELAPPTIAILGKWFVFWSIGVRLLTAGVRQVARPEFTAKTIFHATSADSFVIVRELGFANICLGAIGVVSLGAPAWRIVAACAGGLFFALAGIEHIVKRPAGANEVVAMVSDLFIAAVAIVFVLAR